MTRAQPAVGACITNICVLQVTCDFAALDVQALITGKVAGPCGYDTNGRPSP